MVDTIQIRRIPVEKSRLSTVDFSNIAFGQVYSDHMFTADYVEGQWRDFTIRPYGQLSLWPGTCGLHYGQSVFEGLKAYKNDAGEVLVFRPEMNARRLSISAERMCMPQLPEEIFMASLTEVLRADGDWVPSLPDTSLYIRPFMFATDEYIGLKPSRSYKYILFTCPVGQYYSRPVKVKIETKFSRTVAGGTGFAKAAGNYAGSLYPPRLGQEQGYDQLIWTDGKAHRFIEEAGTMNIMFLIDGVLVTAETQDTVLKGITRDSVLTLAREWGVPVEERPVEVHEVVDAARSGRLLEAFGTGTAATITSIANIGYEGKDFSLPPLTDKSLCARLRAALESIKTGRAEDKYGWIYKV
jgi:branched-chain amino acid aminotransferase